MQSLRWQRLARLDEQAFTQKLDRTVRKAIAAPSGAGKLERQGATSSARSGGSRREAYISPTRGHRLPYKLLYGQGQPRVIW